ncbi:MAG: enoyl-CoA hydratase/isomerase family protein [Deltaproteobacteria bacterium]|nr:enoyl-CoA hydratase/isomerase family protein [Deltaproteobacteria bacterium]
MSGPVELSKQENIGIISIDSPPVNALSTAVRKGVYDCVKEALNDESIQALIITCKGRTFIVGADIREFGKNLPGIRTAQLADELEKCPKPTVAAIHGMAYGGGLEVALGCHYRVATTDAQVAFPEIKLGLLPGGGGTQRAPRAMGIRPALDLILSGDPIAAKIALQQGLIDELVEGDITRGAIAFAQKVVAGGCARPQLSRRNEKIEAAKSDLDVFGEYERNIPPKQRAFEAPYRCIKAVRAAVELPFEEGLKREIELFKEAEASHQSAAQRHVFFAEREVAKIPDLPKETPLIPIRKVGIIGAGTMGGGIAMCFVNAGIPVVLLEQSQQFLDKGIEAISKSYASSVKKGKMSQATMDRLVAMIVPSLSYEALDDVDLVVEAVFEDMGVKKEVFEQLDKICKKEAILATNTSTLDIDEIAASTSRPEQVIGLHFFSPANIMRLLEIVRGAKSSKSVVATSMKLAKTIKKIGVLVGVCHGFVGNRMLYQYRRESMFLLEEGATPEQVDKVITDFGLPMGPFAMADLAGLDIGYRVRKAQGRPKDERYSGTVADRLVEMNRLGQKTKAGFYKYEEGGRTPIPDPEVSQIIEQVSRELNIERRRISDEEILQRCIYPMINEGAKILEERIALRSSDIDIIWINGYGFPIYRGGPMHYAETVGLKNVYEKLCEFKEKYGKVWEPSPLLARLAKEGKKFSEL